MNFHSNPENLNDFCNKCLFVTLLVSNPIKNFTFLTYYKMIYSFGNTPGYFLKVDKYISYTMF